MALHWHDELSADERADLGDRRDHERRDLRLVQPPRPVGTVQYSEKAGPPTLTDTYGMAGTSGSFAVAIAAFRVRNRIRPRVSFGLVPAGTSEPWCPVPAA